MTLERIGELLKEKAKILELSNRDIAQALVIDEGIVSKVLNGKQVNLRNYSNVSNYLGLSDLTIEIGEYKTIDKVH